jgi:hypothetical protein
MKLSNIIDLKSNFQDLNFFYKKNSVLLNLQILKAKIYEKTLNYQNSLFEIEENFMQLKTVLLVIYSYHFFRKTILFVGISDKIITVLNKLEHFHIFLPSKIWLKGIFTNKNSIRRYLRYQKLRQNSKTSKINKLLAISKFPKLIIILSPSINQVIINEIYKLRVPVISFNTISIEKFLYKISTKTGSNLNTILSSLLYSLFIKNKVTNKDPIEKILKNSYKKNRINKLWNKSILNKFSYKPSSFVKNKFQHFKLLKC